MSSFLSLRRLIGVSLVALTATTASMWAAQLTVSWDDNSNGETGFRIERSANGMSYSPLATVGENVTSYVDVNVSAASTYWYRVCAFNATATSSYSNATSATTGGGTPVVPNSPTTTNAGRITRLSVQAVAGPWGAGAMSGSIALSGTSKSVLVRAIGPGLRSYSNTPTLLDPKLSVLAGATTVAANDNWGDGASLNSVFDRVGAFPLANNSKDAAVLTNLAPGTFGLAVTGQKAGLALLEVYDADATEASGRLMKLLVRAPVETGQGVLVAGFTITGDSSLRLLLRAIGPSLSGVQGALANPRLQLYRGTTLLRENDNWAGTAELITVFATVGASSLSVTSRDAALDVTLPPGNYTAVISGMNGTTGLARFEAYVVP